MTTKEKLNLILRALEIHKSNMKPYFKSKGIKASDRYFKGYEDGLLQAIFTITTLGL